MAFLDSIFSGNKTETVEVYQKSQTFVNGVLGPEEWTKTKEFTGLFWRGAMAERYVSERYRADVAGVVVARPTDVSISDIPQSAKLVIDNVDYFVIYVDDVANQGKVIQIPVKKENE